MIADPDGRGLIMFGGKDPITNLPLGDTWQSSNTGLWVRQTSVSRPCARSAHAMAGLKLTDAAASIMFGGIDNFRLDDTWCWNGNGWSFVQTATSPSAREGHAMATDSTRNTIVLYGGFDGSNLGDTWAFDGTIWTQLSPATSPPGRFGHAMAWDANSQSEAFLMFGGNGARSDTWQFDLQTTDWMQHATAPGNTPPGRTDCAIAYYPNLDQVVLFGGLDSSQTPLDDTWVWDRTNTHWVLQNPATRPPARYGHSLVADPSTPNKDLVLFGGRGAGGQVLVGFWMWNGQNWAQLNPPPSARTGSPLANTSGPKTVLFGGASRTTGAELNDTWELTGITWERQAPPFSPSPRAHHGLTHDTFRGRTVMFGGRLPGFVDTNETWEWDGNLWHSIAAPTPPPPIRGAPLVYDRVRDRSVCLVRDETWLYNGNQSTWERANTLTGRPSFAAFDDSRGRMVLFTDIGETYEWDGSRWTFRTRTGPSARLGPAMVYDRTRGVVTLFGGWAGGVTLRDTWEWNGTSWTRRTPATSPPGLLSPGMVYDAARGETVLFGGTDLTAMRNETWVWDGTNWTMRNPAAMPPGRSNANLAYDASRGVVVVFGGSGANNTSLNDTWEWNGSNWTMSNPATLPPVRRAHGTAYDPATQRVLVFGGRDGSNTYYNDTWAWNGADWTLLSPTTSPPQRQAEQRLVTDTAGGRVVLFGGVFGSPRAFASDTWEWDGQNWVKLSAASRPDMRNFHGMCWDPLRQVVVLFGGEDTTSATPKYFGDTWEWNGLAWKDRLLTQAPAPRSGLALAFDSVRNRMVLMGGLNATQQFSDTWEREANDWVQIFPTRSTGPLATHGMTFDPSRERTVALAGTGLAWDYGLIENAATYTEFGSGCTGGSGEPTLATAPGTGPWIGETMTIDMTNLPVGGSAFLLFGPPLAPAVSLTFLGFPASCSLHVSPAVALPASNGTSSFSVSFLLPRQCELIGQTLANQIFAIDSSFSPDAMSKGSLMTFGSR